MQIIINVNNKIFAHGNVYVYVVVSFPKPNVLVKDKRLVSNPRKLMLY